MTIHRPLLSIVLLMSVLTLTACIDESCNFVGPSETASSHEDPAEVADAVVSVYYFSAAAATGNSASPSFITVTAPGGGALALGVAKSGTFIITDVEKGRSITFTASAPGFGSHAQSCSFSGKASIDGIAVEFGHGSGAWYSSCEKW